jgi:hypothetical protein
MAEFKVQLEGIKLSKDATARIQSGIQQLVIHELAGIDNKGDLIIHRPIRIGPILNGIVARSERGAIVIEGISQ